MLFVNVGGTHAGAKQIIAVAMKKSKYDNIMVPFVRGILANWLVCMAMTQAVATNSFVGKFFAVWFPVATFVGLGFEHSIANMFIIPMGMSLGADISVYDFLFRNLVPVTIGNIFAGMFMVGWML